MEFESMREAQEERETYLHDAMAECVKAGVSMESLLTLAFETGFKRVYLDALIDAPLTGRNQYEVRINRRVIATFEHDRQPGGAAQCLRDAADAIDRCRAGEREALLNALLNLGVREYEF